MTTFAVPDDVVIALENDGKGECPECHKRLTITVSGELRSHRCVGDEPRTRNTTGTRKAVKGKRTRLVPDSVSRVGTAALASGIEWSASHLIASYVPCHPSQVPADIPDADSMVGPLVKASWPVIPASVQRIIASICDQEDLILCALEWWAWGRKLQAWAVAAHEHVTQQAQTDGTVSPIRKDTANGIQGPATQPTGSGLLAGIPAFQPESPSDAAL